MSKKRPLIVLAAGGTGGHVFPAEALARILTKRGCDLVLVTDKRGQAFSGKLSEIDRYEVSSGAMTGRGILGKVKGALALFMGARKTVRLFQKIKPDLVIGFGGYPSVPAVAAGIRLRIKTVLHEQNAVLGRANRLFGKHVNVIATSFETVQKIPPETRAICTGNPVRDAVKEVAKNLYTPFTDATKINLLIIGGSQGARIFSQNIPPALTALPDGLRKRLNVTQQCRPEDLETVRSFYEGTDLSVTLKSFFDDMPSQFEKAHLVISRAGASSVAELAVTGRPSLLIPFGAATDDHQTANAQNLVNAKGAGILPENEATPENLTETLQALLSDGTNLATIATHAQKAGRPDAAEKLADIVVGLASGR